jgi:hypothetical protein
MPLTICKPFEAVEPVRGVDNSHYSPPWSRLDTTFHLWHIPCVEWEVEFTDHFEQWWTDLTDDEQVAVNAKVLLLQRVGPALGRPHADVIHSSRHPNMKELIVQHAGHPFRVLYAFDPRRCAMLLLGGDKTGNDRWYEELVPVADRLFDEHLAALQREGRNDG